MTILKCGNSRCAHVFPEDEAGSYEERTRSEFWGTFGWTTERFLCCPLCGEDDDLQEISMCTNCEKEPAMKDDDFCRGCAADADEALVESQLDQIDERSAA